MIEEYWKTKLDRIGFLEEWRKTNFLQIQNKVYTLRTPFLIFIPKEVAERIRGSYNPHLEIGGVMLAVPTLINSHRLLEIRKVVFLKNLSQTPQRSFFRPDFKKDILSIWKVNSKIDKETYVPIWFHSHPGMNVGHILQLQNQIATSKVDQKLSFKHAKINEFYFLIPNVLIVKIFGSRLIIGFYGGGIAPTDFEEYIIKLTGQTFNELWEYLSNWFKAHPKAKWWLLPLGVLITFLAVRYPKQVGKAFGIALIAVVAFATQILPLEKHKTYTVPKYFNILEQDQLAIQIPYYEDL